MVKIKHSELMRFAENCSAESIKTKERFDSLLNQYMIFLVGYTLDYHNQLSGLYLIDNFGNKYIIPKKCDVLYYAYNTLANKNTLKDGAIL